jgi:hypothetical protein
VPAGGSRRKFLFDFGVGEAGVGRHYAELVTRMRSPVTRIISHGESNTCFAGSVFAVNFAADPHAQGA